jgi:hypothetical protein
LQSQPSVDKILGKRKHREEIKSDAKIIIDVKDDSDEEEKLHLTKEIQS